MWRAPPFPLASYTTPATTPPTTAPLTTSPSLASPPFARVLHAGLVLPPVSPLSTPRAWCLPFPPPPLLLLSTGYLTPSSPPSSTVLHIFSIRLQRTCIAQKIACRRAPPSRARPPRLRSLMPFTTKLTLTLLALALLALAHGHSTGTNQRASPPAPRRVFSS